VIHIKDFLDSKSSTQVQENVGFEFCADLDLIPFENKEVEPNISRVQVALLVDKLMAMPEDEPLPDFYESYKLSEDPFERVAESILPDF
jgi:hypothetical protein